MTFPRMMSLVFRTTLFVFIIFFMAVNASRHCVIIPNSQGCNNQKDLDIRVDFFNFIVSFIVGSFIITYLFGDRY
jgi:hypothetical protein